MVHSDGKSNWVMISKGRLSRVCPLVLLMGLSMSLFSGSSRAQTATRPASPLERSASTKSELRHQSSKLIWDPSSGRVVESRTVQDRMPSTESENTPDNYSKKLDEYRKEEVTFQSMLMKLKILQEASDAYRLASFEIQTITTLLPHL